MAKLTTTTLNPLPFEALENRRFEDLIRQLIYDMRPWRMLEATGRSGSDDGYDARGYEVVPDDDNPADMLDVEKDEEPTPSTTGDRVWLIQCKRERVITPAKMRGYLKDISEDEAKKLFGIIFAGACDFSKTTRDIIREWGRTHGVSEVHVWGKSEIEDQLYQPKNDNLLFAYFGISLQIRRRSLRAALRSNLVMKRKIYRHLGDGEHDHKMVLIRDIEDIYYPYLSSDRQKAWHIAEFAGNYANCIKINWRKFQAILHEDGEHWDYANIVTGAVENVFGGDPWIDDIEEEKKRAIDFEIRDFCNNYKGHGKVGTLKIQAMVKYNEILDIDESGDNFINSPHLFMQFKAGRPAFTRIDAELIIPAPATEKDGLYEVGEAIRLYNPDIKNRIIIFPDKLRKEIK